MLTEAGISLSPVTPVRWADRDSIPGEYWAHFANRSMATLAELADAAAAKKQAA